MSQIRQVTEEYKLREVIKTAAQTTVFSALDPTSQRTVVLKLISPAQSPVPDANVGRFLKLMETLSLNRLTGFPALLDYGFTPDNSAFMVTELWQGFSLTDFVGLPPSRTLPLLAKVTKAVEELTRKAQSHLNIRADNILVSGAIDDEDVVLLGLGSAQYLLTEDANSWLGQTSSVQPCAPPELTDASLRDPKQRWRADVYSLAMLVCQLLDARVTGAGTDSPVVDLEGRRGLLEYEVLTSALQTGLRRLPAERKLSFPQLRNVLETVPVQSAGPALFEKTQAISIPRDVVSSASQQPPSGEESLGTETSQPGIEQQPPVSDLAENLGEIGYDTIASVPTEEFARKYGLRNGAATPSRQPEPTPQPEPEDQGEGADTQPGLASPEAIQASPEVAETSPASPQDSDTISLSSEELSASLEETELAPPPERTSEAPSPAPAPAPGSASLSDEHELPPAELSPEPSLPEAIVEPAPEPVPVKEPAPAPVAASTKGRSLAFVAGVTAAALMMFGLTVAGGYWVFKKVAAARVVPTPIPTPVPPTPVPPPTPIPTPVITINPQLELADELMLNGDEAGAQQALDALTDEEIAQFSEQEQALHEELMAAFTASAFDQAVEDLRGGLQYGSVKMLNRAIDQLDAAGPAMIAEEPGLEDELRQARAAMDMHQRLWSAKNAGNLLLVLELGAKMKPLLPGYSGADSLRRQAAVTLMSRVDALIRAGEHERAIDQLEEMRRLWPERQDFEEKISWCRQHQSTDQRLASVLRSAQSKAAGGDPEEALRLLDSVTPEGAYRQQFSQARQVFAAQLAKMDANPPRVALKGGFKLQYKRNTMVRIPIEIVDDYRVVTATITLKTAARPTYSSVQLEHIMDDTYAFQVTPEMHGNKPVYFYVTATDYSGHTGSLGSPEQPMILDKKGWFR